MRGDHREEGERLRVASASSSLLSVVITVGERTNARGKREKEKEREEKKGESRRGFRSRRKNGAREARDLPPASRVEAPSYTATRLDSTRFDSRSPPVDQWQGRSLTRLARRDLSREFVVPR